jgi:hypothetical protein
MPDGFSYRVRFGAGEVFGGSSRTGDATVFLEALEAVRGAVAGKDEAQIRQLLAGELRSRNIDLFFRGGVDMLAAGIAEDDAIIDVGDWGEFDLPDERPGPVGSLIGKAIGRVLGLRFGESEVREAKRELMREVLMASPHLSRLVHADPPDPNLYVPEPGQQPAPAEVITDPDLAERMPWLVERPEPPGFPRSALSMPFQFQARLEEADGTVIVRPSSDSDRIGRLSAKDAEAYLPHLRSAQAQGKVVAAMASGRITGPRALHVTVRLGNRPDLFCLRVAYAPGPVGVRINCASSSIDVA